MNINYAIVSSPLGYLLLGATETGVCAVSMGESPAEVLAELTQQFPAATLRQENTALHEWTTVLLEYFEGQRQNLDLPLDLQATEFQRKVWEAVAAIPFGSTRSYRQVAERLGQPTATRAVAQACAANSVALVIACHRVVQANGELGGYRWGVERKRALLAQEARVAQAQIAVQ